MAAPRFLPQNSSFHAELKTRINAYFQTTNIRPTGNYKLFTKAGLLVLALIGIYLHLVFFTPPAWLALLECVVLGGVAASIGFNIMHDGAHGSFSKFKWLNNLASLSLNVMGGNVFMWNTKHNVIHHAYTNIDGVDDDLDARPFLRLCDSQKRYAIHRFQHWYFWLVYSFLYLFWVYYTDFQKYFTRKVGDIAIAKMKISHHVSFWGFKLLYVGLFVGLPVYMLGFTSWLVGYAVFSLITGLVMSMVFQLAHTVTETHFPQASADTNRIQDEWAIHQLKTTANFATNNKLVSWLAGGLNFQIEHHLFPKISHVHYPAISQIIKQACADFGIRYIEYPSLSKAVISHVSHLKQLTK